ncbi:MAG: hypothetical protein JEZ01_11570 [Labilibaculum sp.]|nr:hypothetical protein [Labilibaculum sp.]MBI9058391.1 hypothetical protein [Labilibaculum sp.]
MKKEIIQTKIDWAATLCQISVGDTHQFIVGAKEVFNIRQVAFRLKKKNRKVFKTSTLENGISVNRVA